MVESGIVVVVSGVVVTPGVVVVSGTAEFGVVVVLGAIGSVLLVVAGSSVALGCVAQAPSTIREPKAKGMANIFSFMVCIPFQ